MILINNKYFNNKEKLINVKSLISYYVETGVGTGVYEKQEGSTWPDGYILNKEKSSCENGSLLSWNSDNNSVDVAFNKQDSCKIYMDAKKQINFASDYIESLLESNPDTMNNDDPDGNIRYVGSNPRNYVEFNGELWKIIGVLFDGEGVEKRVKLVKNESIGLKIWDNSYMSNDWNNAFLKNELNSSLSGDFEL